jgi:membrane protein implicated in regulation of membrane protease activity
VDSPETWRWIWLGAGVIFLLGEMHFFGSFFLLPFAIGAFVAAILAFLGVGLGWEWLAFLVVSLGSLACLYPLRHRLDRSRPVEGIGSRRLIGQPAVVLETVPGGPASELGLVRVGREEWRAESRDGRPLQVGTNVRVIDVQGTRVIVWPVDEIANPPDLRS